MNLINFFVFLKNPPKVKKGRPPQNPLQIAGTSHEMGLSTEAKANSTRYAILINKTNRRNSHVARVPAYSSVKGAVRYIFGASILPNFLTIYLYVKKKTVYKGTNTIYMLSHIYQELFRSGCSFSTFGDEDPQNVRSGRRGEEKWLYSHGKTLVKFIQIH